MTLYTPSLNEALRGSASLQSEQLKTHLKRSQDAVRGLASFVVAEHLTSSTFQAYWRHEERARVTLRIVGQSLHVDLAQVADLVQAQLQQSATLPLPAFHASGTRVLFDAINSIVPQADGSEGRAAVERLQYAAEARAALLRHALATLIQRYTPSFGNSTFSDTNAWLLAFSDLLKEAGEVIVETQRLLWQEGEAVQAHLGALHTRFEQLEEQARAHAVILRTDWRGLLEQTDRQLLKLLEQRQEQVGRLALGEVGAARSAPWLDGALRQATRRAPVIGSLLLTLAGAGAIATTEARPALPDLTFPSASALRAGIDGALSRARPAQPSDEVTRFFTATPGMRGRQALAVTDGAMLARALEELARFGYAPQEVLRLYGLSSAADLTAPLTLEVRWGQGTRPLLLPPASPAPESPPAAPAPAVAGSVSGPVAFVGEAKPVTSLIVHPVAAGETWATLAERYGASVETLRADNHLAAESLAAGSQLLVRVTGRVVSVLPSPSAATSQLDSPLVQTSGSFWSPRPTIAAATFDEAALLAQYGSTVFPSVEAMPEEVRAYFTTRVQEIADFFNVRPGDIVGILQAENNNAGLRLQQPAVSSAGARGVAQVIARTWNGWSNPQTEGHLADLRLIEMHGGLGFDWAMHEAWREWKNGNSDGQALAQANADPDRFENSVSAIARHLVHWGLTRDRASSDPAWFQQQLADSISVYNSGRTLAEAEHFTQSSANHKTTGQYVREAIAVSEMIPLSFAAPVPSAPLHNEVRRLMDRTFGVAMSDESLARTVEGSAVANAVTAGQLSAEQGAQQLLAERMAAWVAEGQAARASGQPLAWPFVHDEATLLTQRLAVQYLGHTLPQWELDALMQQSGGSSNEVQRLLAARGEARLFAAAMHAFDEALQRSERGLPIALNEVAALVRPALAGYNPVTMDDSTVQAVLARIQQSIHQLPEFEALRGAVSGFTATPLLPMPRLVKGFGVPVDYQKGGQHTGIDIANPRVGGQEAPIYAVGEGTVVHVGPLYCEAPNACRGGSAIVIDHGDQVYTLYSHNSAASVTVGQQVDAGEAIGRQGNEGYSFGSHLHFEVHTGAPWSGDWQNPFSGGQFEDPLEWLP